MTSPDMTTDSATALATADTYEAAYIAALTYADPATALKETP